MSAVYSEGATPAPGVHDAGLGAATITALARDGWALHRGAGEAGRAQVIAALGMRVTQRTDVVVGPGRALVSSERGLGLHTDHHRAAVITWLGRRPSSEGGLTLVADARAAFRSLSDDHRADLAKISLFEHAIFPGDPEIHPLVEHGPGGPLFYYSFWLADEALPDALRPAFVAFERAASDHLVARIRLEADDLLVVDNRRMLHGRTAITGTRDRHLERYWLTRPAQPGDLA